MKRDPIRNGLPSTVRLWGGTGAVLLPVEWMKYAIAINPGRALNYQFDNGAFKGGVGWHNQGEPNRVEELAFSGNIVEVLRIDGNKAFVKTYFTSHAPLAVITPMPEKPHSIVQNFSIQYTNHLDMSTDGRYARTFLIANPGEELWIDISNLVKV
jgi:hypothetical protein